MSGSTLRYAVDPDETGAYRTKNVVFREALSGDAPSARPSGAPRPEPPATIYDHPSDDDDDGPATVADYDHEGGGRRGERAARGDDDDDLPGDDAICCECSEGFAEVRGHAESRRPDPPSPIYDMF